MSPLSMPQLIGLLEPDETVYLAGSSGEPQELSALLSDAGTAAPDAHFLTSFVPGINGRCLARPGRNSRTTAFFMQPALRAADAEGRVAFMPVSYFGIQRHLSSAATPIDTVVVQVSPPGRNGECSLGPAVEFMPSVLERAGRILGIVNPAVPDLEGAPRIAMDRFEAVAHSTHPLATYEVGAPSATAAAIVGHLAGLIPSGASLQLGLGKIPSQLAEALAARRDLQLHTGMISDAALKLAEAGALRAGKPIVSTVAVGGADFYRRLAGLRGLELAPVSHTHDPSVLAAVPRLHAVNSALEVDLLGQLNAEMLDGQYVSGPGGLPDFARAAHLDPEGLSIVALNASERGGKLSKIVARLGAGTPVTVPQHDVDAVVTEYGIAMLRGAAIGERMHRLCAIAHPDHRDRLRAEARVMLRRS